MCELKISNTLNKSNRKKTNIYFKPSSYNFQTTSTNFRKDTLWQDNFKTLQIVESVTKKREI